MSSLLTQFLRQQRFFLLGLALSLLWVSSCGGGGRSSGFTLDRSSAVSDINSCLTFLKKKKYDPAVKCLESYRSANYGKPGAVDAELAIAATFYLKKDFILAAEAYNNFIKTHPFHSKVPFAYFRLGMSYYSKAPKTIDRDLSDLDQAIEAFSMVLRYYSSTQYGPMAKVYLDQARRKKAQHHYYVARYYYKSKEYLAAIPRFQNIVTNYPKLGLDEKSFYYLITALQKTKQDDIAAKYYEVYKKHFPDSAYVKKIKL